MTFTLPNDYLSASSLNCLLTCPRMYEFRYVDKLPTAWRSRKLAALSLAEGSVNPQEVNMYAKEWLMLAAAVIGVLIQIAENTPRKP